MVNDQLTFCSKFVFITKLCRILYIFIGKGCNVSENRYSELSFAAIQVRWVWYVLCTTLLMVIINLQAIMIIHSVVLAVNDFTYI